MKRRTLLAATAATALPGIAGAQAKTKIVWWHAMGGARRDPIDRLRQRARAPVEQLDSIPGRRHGGRFDDREVAPSPAKAGGVAQVAIADRA